MITNVITISGPAHVGKDTVCDLLIETFAQRGIGAVRASFADSLKEEVARLTGVPLKAFYDSATKESWRPLLQGWGDYRRNGPREVVCQTRMIVGFQLDAVPFLTVGGCHPDYWVEEVAKKLRVLNDGHTDAQVAIVPDCRYANEIAFALKAAEHLRLDADKVRSRRLSIAGLNYASTVHSSHSSEAGVPPQLTMDGAVVPTFTDVLFNDHALGKDYLEGKVAALVTEWLARDEIVTSGYGRTAE